MFPGQPAENSEQLRVGDIILAANGVSLLGKTSRDAINVLRDQPTRVVLTVKRDPSSIPPGLLRRGSFSQSLDPNEVLSAIHSKLQADDDRPGNEESNPREIREPHENASRKSSLINGGNDVYMEHGSTSQDNTRTYEDTSGPTELLRNDSGSQSIARRSSNEISHMAPEDNPRAYGPGGETVEELGSGYNFGGSMLEDHFIRSGDLEDEMKNTEARTREYNPLVEEEIPSPLEGVDAILQTGGKVDDESKSTSGLFQHSKKERLAPEEEVRFIFKVCPRTFLLTSKISLVQVLDVVLHKGSSGLGFTLAGGADTVGGCFVREIIGDPARSDGRLRPKDQIVLVSGELNSKAEPITLPLASKIIWC